MDISKVEVCVVSPRNYFIFTPMLAAASVGTVEYRSILEHIRSANPTIGYLQGSMKMPADIFKSRRGSKGSRCFPRTGSAEPVSNSEAGCFVTHLFGDPLFPTSQVRVSI